MQHAPSTQFLQHELRSQICRRCYLRPPGSASWGPDVRRGCEGRCAIFAALPRVRRISQYLDPMIEPYERAVRHLYGDACSAEASAEWQSCDRRALCRYQDRVIEVMTAVLNRNG
jgi:hypothetical protein